MTISRFENKWLQKIRDELLKSFPDDFLDFEDYEIIELPQKPLLKGSELFGSYEIIDTSGSQFLITDSVDKMKYILYSNLNKPVSTKIPKDRMEIKDAVKRYEKHLDELLRMIIKDYKAEFPSSNEHIKVSSKIFQLLNLHRY